MIVERNKNKNMDQIMYAEDFNGSAKDDDDQDSGDGEGGVTGGDGDSKKKRLSKEAKPREITEDGLLYHLILTYFLQQELRPYVSPVNLAQIQLR
jgi:hypothetical protein